MDLRFMEEVVGTLFPGAANEEEGRFTDEEEQERQPPEVGARNRGSPRKN